MDDEKKKVDEAWKDQVAKESQAKEEPKEPQAETQPEPDFKFFITSLAVQASIALGAMPNPANEEIEVNLNQAKLIIDTLGIIKEKTQGNLNSEEDSLLDNLLYELRMQYLSQAKGQQK